MKSSCKWMAVTSLVALVLACETEAPGPETTVLAPLDAGQVDARDASVSLEAEPEVGPFVLVASVPPTRAVVYPKRIYDLTGSPAQHRVEATLSAPPAPGARPAFVLAGGTDTRRIDAVCAGSQCSAIVPDTPYVDAAGQPRNSAFRYASSYAVALEGLGGPSRAPTFSFDTLPIDEELEHTCGHTIDPTSVTLGLADQPSAAAVISLTHRRHRIAFPVGGASTGTVSLRVPGEGAYPYALYLSVDLAVDIRRSSDGARMSAFTTAVPAACDRLVAVSRVTLYGGELYDVRFVAPANVATFELYLERKTPARPSPDGGACRTSGPCRSDSECCDFCHEQDHCH
jgi:hypothetical protein